MPVSPLRRRREGKRAASLCGSVQVVTQCTLGTQPQMQATSLSHAHVPRDCRRGLQKGTAGIPKLQRAVCSQEGRRHAIITGGDPGQPNGPDPTCTPLQDAVSHCVGDP
uniref:Uncharacterized protein n=1 Tax=Eutreptiella gymnastica TaxID=73025 RepID=A0A7S4GFD3_9EUGL